MLASVSSGTFAPLGAFEHPTSMSIPDWIRAAREQWTYRGQHRPTFAHEPGPDQESVWDFPRPPALREVSSVLGVKRDGAVIARTERGLAVCETAHPPTYYFPPSDVNFALLKPSPGSSLCEWKGPASYYDVMGGPRLVRAAWSYESPFDEFRALAGYVASGFRAVFLE